MTQGVKVLWLGNAQQRMQCSGGHDLVKVTRSDFMWLSSVTVSENECNRDYNWQEKQYSQVGVDWFWCRVLESVLATTCDDGDGNNVASRDTSRDVRRWVAQGFFPPTSILRQSSELSHDLDTDLVGCWHCCHTESCLPTVTECFECFTRR